MKRIIIVIFPLIYLLVGCSASKSELKIDSENTDVAISSENEKLAQDYFIKGALYDLKGEFPAAILEYQEALKLDEQAGIHHVLSKDYLIIQKLAPALSHAKSAVKLSPDDAEYNFLLGSIYKMAQRPDSAELSFEKVIKIDSLNTLFQYEPLCRTDHSCKNRWHHHQVAGSTLLSCCLLIHASCSTLLWLSTASMNAFDSSSSQCRDTWPGHSRIIDRPKRSVLMNIPHYNLFAISLQFNDNCSQSSSRLENWQMSLLRSVSYEIATFEFC